MSLVLALALLGASAAGAAPADYSDPNAVQPYIETLKKKYDLKPKPLTENANPGAVKRAAPAENLVSKPVSTNPKEVQPYIEHLREENGLSSAVSKDGGSGPDVVQPHIEALKKDADLEPKFKGTVDMAAGFSFVASNQFNITASKGVQANSFEAVYAPETKYAPSADVFVEKQFYRNRYVGAFGAVGHVNVITIAGKGIFTATGAQAPYTTFRFLAVPFSVGASYRFLMFRFIDPFMSFSAVGIPFLETRNDNRPARRGISRGFNFTTGLAFNLDWITRRDAWDMYDNNGVLHTYLVTQLQFLRTLSGSVDFAYNGTYVGLMFEF